MTLCDVIRWREWNDMSCTDCKAIEDEKKKCEDSLSRLISQSNKASEEYAKQVDLNLKLSKDLDACMLSNDELRQQLEPTSPEEEFWNNKYPRKTILYNGRNFGTTSVMIPIDVKLMVTPQDAVIQNIVKQGGFEITDPETDVPAIYSWLHQYFKYEYDKKSMGLSEHWKFPFETIYQIGKKKGSDCDDWALLQASLYIAAGMPSWKVRCVAGLTPSGAGHLTVGVYSEVTKDYRHLNSTYYGSKALPKKLSEYKRSGDPIDPMNITDVWFSLNNLDTWSSFLTTAAENSFKKQKLFTIT